MLTRNQYEQQAKLLNELSYAYYTLDQSLETDLEYDYIFRLVKEYEDNHPDEPKISNPTNRVGDNLNPILKKHKHKTNMYSLDNVYSFKELSKWINNILKSYPNATFAVSPKLDGLSIDLYYTGSLLYGITRGDGQEGELVTDNVKHVKNVNLANIPEFQNVELRGEILMLKSTFNQLNESRLQQGLRLFSTPRNAAAGSLRQLDPSITKERNLVFIPFGYGILPTDLLHTTYSSTLANLQSIYKNTDKLTISTCSTVEQVEQVYQSILKDRDTLDTPLDGVVVCVDQLSIQQELGYTNRVPRFSIAYKFPAIEYKTTLLDVTHTVGRTGKITPVGIIDTVKIDGVNVSKVTLHNYNYISGLDLHLQDDIFIMRSGDVIPKLITNILPHKDTSVPIGKPDNCPTCNTVLQQNLSYLYCPNIECKDRVIKNILHYINVYTGSNPSSSIIKLYNAGLLGKVHDIYSLTEESVYNVLQNTKLAKELVKFIKHTRNRELPLFIQALGIPNVGYKVAELIAIKYGKKFHLVPLEEMTSCIRDSVKEFLSTYSIKYVYDLLDLAKPKSIQPIKLRICITGTLSLPREQVKQQLAKHGIQVVSNVTRNTDILVTGFNPTQHKVDTAIKNGIPIEQEEYLYQYMDR